MLKNMKTSMFSKMTLLLVFLLVAIFAIAACGDGDETVAVDPTPDDVVEDVVDDPADDVVVEEDDEEAVADEAPEGTPGGTLVHAAASEAPHMDPIGQNDSATSDFTNQVYEGLVQFLPVPYNEIVPLLATDWTQLDDVTWEFNLRSGVYFHDGSYFTADAWRLSIERLLCPRQAAPGAFILEMIDEIIAVDDYTLHIVLEFEFTPLLGALTHQVGFAVSRQAMAAEVLYRMANFEPYDVEDEDGNVIETVDEFVPMPWQEDLLAYAEARGLELEPILVTHAPVGTGPFEFAYQVSGDYTRLRAFEGYWRDRANIDYVIIQVVPDASTRFAMLQTGEANTLPLQPVDVGQMEVNPHLTRIEFQGTGIDYIGFNMDRPPFDDIRVRRALTYAINKESVIAAAFEGLGTPATGPIGPNVVHSAADELEGMQYNPERARELLEEAGYGDGLELSIWYNYGNAARGVMAQVAQHYWAQVGVNVSIESVEWGAYLTMTGEGEHDMFILGWTTITGDADYGMYSLFTTHNFGNAGNRTFYSNPRVDELLGEGRRSTDYNERQAIYREVTEILIYDAPWIFVRTPISNWGTNGVAEFAVNFNNTPMFYLMTLE